MQENRVPQKEIPMAKVAQTWDVVAINKKGGDGDWRTCELPYEAVQRAAERWRSAVAGLEKLWLCWNINTKWCGLQQRLANEVGWTPVVGWDPACGDGRPSFVLPSAVAIDFNHDLDLPVMFMHFPLEFAFLWCEKLAFWHSDLLLRHDQMAKAARRFESVVDGEMAAVFSTGGWRNALKFKKHRYFELLGCTTRGASRDQFENGCGWWRRFGYHWNSPADARELARRRSYYGEHGVGIRYWERHCGGRVHALKERDYSATHFSVTSIRNYRKCRNKSDELAVNFDLDAIAKDMDIADLLER